MQERARSTVRVVCLALLVGSVSAAAPPAPEYAVKAAFLLNFTKFVDWPSTAFADGDSPFSICILGKDPFGTALDEIVSGETVGTHRLAVRRIDQKPAPKSCQILFVNNSLAEPAAFLRGVGSGVLTVGDSDRLLHDGAMIAFVIDNHRVRFDVNRSRAEAAGLKLSSKMLSVARSIQK